MKKFGRTALRVFLIVGSVFLVITVIGTVVFTVYIHTQIDTDVSDIVLLSGNQGNPSQMYAVTEQGLSEVGAGELVSGKYNEYATLEDIPDDLEKAFIAIEDKRFYSHKGFDFITTVKAAWKYLFSSGSTPGGSTITQQLIKNITGDDEITIHRKLEEIMRAIALEKELSKDAILELYLNTIYLSQGAYGVKAAAEIYFNKDISQLTLIESAAIAAITQAPTKWNPILHPENNAERRNLILEEMYAQGFISTEEFQEAYGQELTLSVNNQHTASVTTSWYTDAVIDEAVALLSDTLSVSRQVALQHLYNGGYRIIIAEDPSLQAIVERYYADADLFGAEGVQSAFVVMDPKTGNILALAGGLGNKPGSRVLNRAVQTLRSPGSSIKPLSVYAPALEAGLIHYGSAFDDAPVRFDTAKRTYWPHNASGVYAGLVSLEYAISRSLNTVSVKVLDRLGIDASYQFLTEQLGFTTLDDMEDRSASALAMGGMKYGVSLASLVSGYTALANDGIYSQGRTVLKILDRSGNVIVDNTAEGKIVLSEETTQTLTKLLTKVISESGGTANGGVTQLNDLCDVAGKTGTTDDNRDRWFVGYTPDYLAGIWLGYDTPASLSKISLKKHIRVWDEIMTEITKQKEKPTEEFDFGLLVEAHYCACSGDIPTEACLADPRGSQSKTGYFTVTTLPQTLCETHILLDYCTEGEGIAGSACPLESLTKKGLLLVDRSFPFSITIADAEYTAMKLPLEYLPYMGLSEPYYQNYVPDDVFVGKSRTSSPYNRFCTRHFPAAVS